jgi:hypothetical protein
MKLGHIAIAALAILVLLAGAQAQRTDNGSMPDLEGGWLRLDTGGGGSYHGIDLMFPKAELTPQYAKFLPPDMDEGLSGNAPAAPPHQAGQPYVVYQPGARGGGGGGFGVGIDINSAPFFLVQTKNEILITREGAGPGRHIFMDGRAHPDPSEFVLNGAGHSVGHYENGKLVVDTTDFAPGMTGFGRGYKGPHTHLTETFDLSADGQRLTIHYKWDDPEIYEKPLVYDISFERLPKGSYVTEDWNDAADPLSYQSIVPPEQK